MFVETFAWNRIIMMEMTKIVHGIHVTTRFVIGSRNKIIDRDLLTFCVTVLTNHPSDQILYYKGQFI